MNIVIANVFGIGNKGDWILFLEIVRVIKSCFPQANIYAIGRDIELQKKEFPDIQWTQRIETSFQKNKFLRKLENLWGLLKIIAVSKSKMLFDFFQEREESLQVIKNADLFVMCPGGYWDSSHPSFISNLINFKLLTSCNKRTILAPQSIEKIRNPLLSKVFSKYISQADLICLREQESYEYVSSLNLSPDKLMLTPDLAFYHNYQELGQEDRSSIQSLNLPQGDFISCTALKWHFPTSNNPQESHQKYILSVAQTAKYFADKYSMPMVLIRQIGHLKNDSADLDVLKEIEHLSDGSAYVLENDLHPDDLIHVIKKSVFLVGSRMHSNIFAFLAGRPVVAISYQKKTNGIMKMMSLDDYIIPIDEINGNILIKKAEAVFSNQELISEKIAQNLDRIRTKREELLKQFKL